MVYLAVGLGGIAGALLRYYLGLLIYHWWVYPFPLATLLTNYIGCFLLGWLTSRAAKWALHPYLLTGLGTGLIGSFTTFSTFSMETVTLLNEEAWGMAGAYVLLSLCGGLLISWLGFRKG